MDRAPSRGEEAILPDQGRHETLNPSSIYYARGRTRVLTIHALAVPGHASM
jgi:hypothetical protein